MVPVPELKEQIASVTGVLSEQQRLICRGRILKDDQLLSSYHVEDGHTLHLIMRQPVVPSSDSSLNQPGGEQGANSQNAGTHGNDGQYLDAATGSLTELMLLTGQMIIEQGTESLLLLAWQLEGHPSVTDPLERSLLRNLGALLLVLGRTITNLQMGQTPTDALANAGPPVFLSSRGPDPIMVQPLPFLEEASFGVNPLRTFEHGSGLSGGSPASGFLPMNMSTRIRTGSLLLQREPTSSQPQGQGFPLPPNGNSDQRDAAGLDPNSSTGVSQAQDVSSSHGAAATEPSHPMKEQILLKPRLMKTKIQVLLPDDGVALTHNQVQNALGGDRCNRILDTLNLGQNVLKPRCFGSCNSQLECFQYGQKNGEHNLVVTCTKPKN
ncbi:Ubiquitin-like superfamily protein [Abeliophyllum distichum]|uniref:Ubiquitin-like superfamily protein n=1 Tax=Abeliophyllum distichum TaxID=126358 RepID=A0ABD1Q6R5_9LAMI